MYSFMITKYADPTDPKLYGQRALWQNDPATSHQRVLSFCLKDPTYGAGTYDGWYLACGEHLSLCQGDVKVQGTKEQSPAEDHHLYIGCGVNSDKELCKRLIQSIHPRLETVINKEGRHFRKEDYEMDREEQLWNIVIDWNLLAHPLGI
jgi:hypothetical protein